MKLGNANVNKIRLGSTQMKRVYLGSNIVWQNAPTAIAATGVGTTSFTANWEAYSGATYYLLDVSEFSDFSTFVYQNEIVLAPNTSYVVIGVQSNTTYYYRVRASDDTDYQEIINYATTQGYTLPSLIQQEKQNKLLINLKLSGIWDKLDTFAVFATDAEDSPSSGTSDFALIDWKRLTQYTAVNSPTFTTNGGFNGNGTSSYIDTNYNPSTQRINYQQINAGRFFWVDNRLGSIWEGNSTTTNDSRNGVTTTIKINQGTSQLNSAVTFNVDGFKSINRTSSTNVEVFTDTTQNSRTSNSAPISSLNQFVLRGANSYSASRFRFYAMGASLVSENTDFYNAMNTYFTSL
jgi:hypothetical protein